MKPFDLEKAKAGEPIITRNGLPARIICFDRKASVYPIVALVGGDVNEVVESFTIEGTVLRMSEYPLDLFMKD